VLLAASVAIGATASASPRHQKSGPHAASTSCFKTFQSGSGAAFFRWCFNTTGSIVSIESPVGFEHIHNGTVDEGYAVCANGVTSAYDLADHGAGWGPATFTAPNKITRSTSDGVFRLVQVFTQSVPQRQIFITATLTNISGSSKTGIAVSKAFDGDIDNDSSDDTYVQTKASVIGIDQHGLELTTTSFTTNHVIQIEAFPTLDNDTGCLATATATSPTSPGDWAGRDTYLIGGLGAGQSKTVVFRYSLV
jgi:hypothetical protein